MIYIVDRVMDVPISNEIGEFLSGAYRTVDERGVEADHLLLYLNLKASPCLLRINSACYTGDLFGDQRCDCAWQFQEAIRLVHRRQQGLIIYHTHHEGRGNGILGKLRSIQATIQQGVRGRDAYRSIGLEPDRRQYESSVLILRDLCISSVRLITNNPDKQLVLERAGVEVVDRVSVLFPDPSLTDYYNWKREHFGHFV